MLYDLWKEILPVDTVSSLLWILAFHCPLAIIMVPCLHITLIMSDAINSFKKHHYLYYFPESSETALEMHFLDKTQWDSFPCSLFKWHRKIILPKDWAEEEVLNMRMKCIYIETQMPQTGLTSWFIQLQGGHSHHFCPTPCLELTHCY